MLRLVANQYARSGSRHFSNFNKSLYEARIAERGKVTMEQRAALRAARKDQAAQVISKETSTANQAASTSSSSSSSAGTSFSASTVRMLWYAGAGVPTLLLAWGIYDSESLPAKFAEFIGITSVIKGFTKQYTDPISTKLVPDWSQMPNVPQNIPLPHTLVLDLEDTLVHSTWDRKHGWRHAKRPGVDKFLTTMAQYYEIILYSPSIDGVAIPVVDRLDPQGLILHRIYRDGTLYTDGRYCKVLKNLNRPQNRMVVLDDDASAYLGDDIDNVILIKPYSDPNDREDRTLERITPLLLEIARENYDDVPTLLKKFKSKDGNQIANEYHERVDSLKSKREAQYSKGIASFAKNIRNNRPIPELSPVSEDDQAAGMSGLTSKDIVGSAPVSNEIETGDGVIGWYKKRQQEKAEHEARKAEKWNEIMLKKHEEKQKQEKALANS